MDLLFLGIVVFLFVLAVFDLSVGVSNDAVNFLSSAIGSKAAKFKTIIIVAAVGVFFGAAMSNGMMDIARHGMFRPENLSFYDVIAIFMAVMVTDIILLDIFNSLGMPTSTTVSLVFELLGAAFVVALFKISDASGALGLGDLLNTEKAMTVIIGIFLSVAIAFFFGTLVQFIARLIFGFHYKSKLKWKIGLFGGVACTALIYFMLLKGIKDLNFMTADLKAWINDNTCTILLSSFVIFTVLMQILHWLRVNVLKVVVLLGTFSLAMAFAGNDLVNFIGVPLTGMSALQDYTASGGADVHSFMMDSLNKSANTPIYFLIGAGIIMVIALATSKKARQVTQTTVGLSSQSQGDEMFGSSRLGRALVRMSLNSFNWVTDHTPLVVRNWISKRMDSTYDDVEEGAAFDLIRAAVNLIIAGILIAVGTSLKLPLSTTFVTFMVAMGSSLADKAWGRESAVFRITGVISIIGGWFITAGAAFIGAGLVVALMHVGGTFVMVAGGILSLVVLIRSNVKFRNKKKVAAEDTLFQTILGTNDEHDVWGLLRIYINEKQKMFLEFAETTYADVIDGFLKEKPGILNRAQRALITEKDVLKGQRRKLTLCLRKVSYQTAIEKSTWFHLSNNMQMSMTYNLRRINEICKEHVDNNFRPLPQVLKDAYEPVNQEILKVFRDAAAAIEESNPVVIDTLRERCNEIKHSLTHLAQENYQLIHGGNQDDLAVAYVYLNILTEGQELVTALRKMLRASGKLNLAPSEYRSFTEMNTI